MPPIATQTDWQKQRDISGIGCEGLRIQSFKTAASGRGRKCCETNEEVRQLFPSIAFQLAKAYVVLWLLLVYRLFSSNAPVDN
jgi:hypothetical protein